MEHPFSLQIEYRVITIAGRPSVMKKVPIGPRNSNFVVRGFLGAF